MKLTNKFTLEELKIMARYVPRLVYAAQTCWWKIGNSVYRKDNQVDGLPCGPRGEMLLETNKPLNFIEQAEKNPDHYGKHGLDAFVAAYHENVVTDEGIPTSFEGWHRYNELIDEAKSFPRKLEPKKKKI